MRKLISTIFVLLILINSILAQSPFTAEEIGVLEEEYAEEVIIIEDRAGTTPDSPLYVLDEVVEDVTLLIKKGEDKAEFALDVKGEKIAEATLMVGENKSMEAMKALAKANNVSDIVADEVGLKLGEDALVRAEIDEEVLKILKGKLPTEAEWKEVNGLVEGQRNKEEKIKLASGLAKKIGNYCEGLAKLDYNLMEADEHCDPGQAPDWLRDYIEEEIQERQKEAEDMMLEMIITCINDPRDCDCSQIPVKSEQRNCERNTMLAIKCEFEEDISACEQLGEPEMPSGMPDFLRPIFEETITELIAKKEKEMFAKFAPSECVEAGLTDREECEELMMEKYLPPECKEAGATSEEECKALMVEIYGEPPAECVKEDGSMMDKDECEAVMIDKFDIPDECIIDGHPISEEECFAIAMPEECKEAGATNPDECQAVMEKLGGPPGGIEIPPECIIDGEFVGQEECEELVRKKMEEEGIEMPLECFDEEGIFVGQEECERIREEEAEEMEGPSECYIDREFIGREECDKLMFGEYPEEFPEGYTPEEKKDFVEERWEGYEALPVRKDLVIIKNPETGESEIVTKEEAKEWIEENIGEYVEEEIAPGEEIEFLKEEIEEIKELKEKGIPFEEKEFEEVEGKEEFEEGEGFEEEIPQEHEEESKEETEMPPGPMEIEVEAEEQEISEIGEEIEIEVPEEKPEEVEVPEEGPGETEETGPEHESKQEESPE